MNDGLKMTYWACRISAWARFLYLDEKLNSPVSFLNQYADSEELAEHKYLSDWWRGIGDSKQLDIIRFARELSQTVFSTNVLWNANTRGAHTKGEYNGN